MAEIFKGAGLARFGAMAGIAAALTGFFLYVAGAISEPPQAVLFSGLDPRDAAAVTAKLDGLGITYEPRGDGATLMVPADQVQKVRMQLASEGLPSVGVGYEIFDNTNSFGATAFVQNVNRLRAMEGELARSIRTIDTVGQARVHLVIPEHQIFSRDAQEPSASVVVKARGGTLSRGQVAAIQHLVAASVARLKPSSVAIIDDKGQLLAGGSGESQNGAIASHQEERSTSFEERLRERVETIVASTTGPGGVRAQVAAEMDFNRVTESAETYDPDGRVVRSSQTVEQLSNEKDANGGGAVSIGNALPGSQSGGGANGDGSNSSNTRTEETVNYEISKRTKTEVLETGRVKRLSVAVVVDGTYEADANGARTYAPRTAEEMTKITELVKTAIGYDEKRGDQLKVTNMQFARIDTGPEEPAEEPLLGFDIAFWLKLGQSLILGISALLVGLLVVRPMVRRLTTPAGMASGTALVAQGPQQAQLGAPSGQQGRDGQAQAQIGNDGAQAALPAPRRESMIDISQIEGQVRESSIRKVGEVVTAHPEEAMAILRTWLHQPA